ncbi:MAG: hypothetical protein RIT28_3802 [Pseudomonadota bacterium]
MPERRQEPLRFGIFAEGSRSPRGARVDYFEQIWRELLPRLVGRPAPAHVFPIDKASIEAMNPASPKSTGRGEALDDRVRRELLKTPFDCVIVAWDLHPSLASAMTPPQCRWNETLRLYEGLAREGSMLPPEWLKSARAKLQELQARAVPSARGAPPRLERHGIYALCMAPEFEGLLTRSEANVRAALGAAELRIKDWPSWRADPQGREAKELLNRAINTLRALPKNKQPKVFAQINGDMKNAHHEWAARILKVATEDSQRQAALSEHPIAARLTELLPR